MHDPEAVSELAPSGVLRAINMGNSQLVTGSSPTGEPQGVSLAKLIEKHHVRGLSVAPASMPAGRAAT